MAIAARSGYSLKLILPLIIEIENESESNT